MADLDQTKARLLEAAGEEFAEHGFAAARVRSICRKAGAAANPAAVNYHFGGKEQLYIAAVLEAHRCETRADDDIATATDPGLVPADALRAFVRRFLEHVLHPSDRGWHHALMLREMLQPSGACEAVVRESIRPRFERLLAILRQFCPLADTLRLHALAFSVIGQCLHYKFARPVSERLIGLEAYATLDVDYLTDHVTNLVLAALGRIDPLGPDGAAGNPTEPGEVGVPCRGSR
jgi:TetR/AcrR family transcriptional regulator, regulator of cefoperazone and chloramphenicol sensitivity